MATACTPQPTHPRAGGPLDLPPEQVEDLLVSTARAVSEHLGSVADGPVASAEPVHPATVRSWLADTYPLEEPQSAATAVRDLVAALRRWGVHTTHPGYFGLFNPTPTAAGVAGELLAAAVNPQLAAWSHAPVAVEAEQHVLRFLAGRLGLASGAVAGNITTGGAEANLTAVLLALTRAFPGYADQGLRGLPGRPVFYASAESHLAWVKIAHGTGLGRDALRLVDVDEHLRMDTSRLHALVEADRAAGHLPFLVVGTAGTTGAGIIDPLRDLAELAGTHGLWLHTDAAWAGAISLSDRLRPLLAGIERSDSVTLDAHKWLSVPMGAGTILTPHAELLARTFRLSTGYMPGAVEDAADPYTTSVQWSRRFAGLKILLSLVAAGRSGYAAQIERDTDLGTLLADRLRADGWQRLNHTPLPVVCVTDPATEHLDPATAWAWHDAVADRVVRGGTSWISPVRVAGRPALRACITSHRTTSTDVDRLVDALRHARDREPPPRRH
ncbi:pyridoxal phosphate-dependent decarboxylase family protein [Pseudonocardia sichuanensis]